MNVTDDDLEAAVDRALRRFDKPDRDIWMELGGHRDDARQAGLIAAWKQIGKIPDDVKSLGAWLNRAASFGLRTYYGKLKADRDKRSPTRVVPCGLDDLPVDMRFPERSLDETRENEDGDAMPCVPAPEVQGQDAFEEVSDRELLAKLKLLLNGGILGALEDRERWAICHRFGIKTDIAGPKKLRQGELTDLVDSAMMKLRAEMRADEIMEL